MIVITTSAAKASRLNILTESLKPSLSTCHAVITILLAVVTGQAVLAPNEATTISSNVLTVNCFYAELASSY